jgi:hypothetical protein
MLAQSSNSLFQLLESIDRDALAVIFILATIGTFFAVIFIVGFTMSTVKSISTTRMTQTMIRELLNKGYSVDDVERLVYGAPLTQKVKNLFTAAQRRVRPHNCDFPPSPPIKQPA